MTNLTPIELPADDSMEKQPSYTTTHEITSPTGSYAHPTGSPPPPTFSSTQTPQPQPTQPQMAYQQEKTNNQQHEYYQEGQQQGQPFIPQPNQPTPPPAMNYHQQQQQQPQMQQHNQYQIPTQPVPPPVTALNAIQYQTATPIPSLGMSPAPVDCPMCGQRRMTSITHQAGNTTHVWAILTFCFTGCLCFIPYLMNGLKDVQHRCGNCGCHLVTWHKSGQVEVHAHA